MGESEELISQPRMIETDIPLQPLWKMASKIHKHTAVNFNSWREDFWVVLSVFPLGEEIIYGNIAPGHPQYSSRIDKKMALVIEGRELYKPSITYVGGSGQ